MRQYFFYRIRPSVGYEKDGPASDFPVRYTECKGIASVSDNLVPLDHYKVLPNGEISGIRVGELSWDTDGMAALGYDDATVLEELARVGVDFAIRIVSNDTLSSFLRSFSSLTESPEGVFSAGEKVILDLR